MKLKVDGKPVDVGTVWWFWFTTNAFAVDKRLRHILRFLPQDPRCRFCNAPFRGIGATVVRVLFGKQRSDLNPRYCNLCEQACKGFPGGADVPMAILFADVRGSTALSERMDPVEFRQFINRFYREATHIVTEADGLVDKLAGDSIAAFWGAGFAGPDYVARTVEVARKLASAMSEEDIPVGVGVHAGIAFFGAIGSEDGLTDITAIGEEVNTAARLASKAAAGEVVISEQALEQAHIDAQGLESRSLDLKGISEPVRVRVMQAS